MTATRLTTEHLQGSARLQEQNEELRQELESMEVGRVLGGMRRFVLLGCLLISCYSYHPSLPVLPTISAL